MTATFFSLSIRTYFKVSKVFLANLDMDFVKIISTSPFKQSLISLWKSSRFATRVHVMASSE